MDAYMEGLKTMDAQRMIEVGSKLWSRGIDQAVSEIIEGYEAVLRKTAEERDLACAEATRLAELLGRRDE